MAHINFITQAPALGVRNGLADFNFSFDQMQTYSRAFAGMAFVFQGNTYQVAQNRSGGALAAGDAVSLYIGGSDRTGNLTAASTKAVLTTDDTLDANLKGSSVFPSRIFTTAGALATTATMEERIILKNSTDAGASTVTVSVADPLAGPNEDATTGVNAYSVAPANTWDYAITTGFEVVKADIDALATAYVQGVVVSTSITDDYFGIICVKGVVLAKVNGTTDLAAGDQLVVGSDAGVLVKHAIAGANPTAAESVAGLKVCGRILEAYTDNSAGLRAIQLFGTHAILPDITV